MFNIFTLSFIGATIFGIIAIIVHLLREDLVVSKNALSRYAIGKNGWILTLGFFSLAFSELLLSVALIKEYGISAGGILLGLAGVGILLLATFKMELTENKTINGQIHNIGAGIEFLFFPISLLILSPIFENYNISIFSKIIGFITLILFFIIAFLHIKKLTNKINYFGIIQKSNIFFITFWLMYASYMLM